MNDRLETERPAPVVSERVRLLGRAAAMIAIVAVVAMIVRETSTSSTQQTAAQRIAELEVQIERVEQENVGLRERLTYAQAVPALRHIAKRDLGLVDPGDRAIVIIDDLTEAPRQTPIPTVPTPPPPPTPIPFGHVDAWLETFTGG